MVFFAFPEDARWNGDRGAVEFTVLLGGSNRVRWGGRLRGYRCGHRINREGLAGWEPRFKTHESRAR